MIFELFYVNKPSWRNDMSELCQIFTAAALAIGSGIIGYRCYDYLRLVPPDDAKSLEENKKNKLPIKMNQKFE